VLPHWLTVSDPTAYARRVLLDEAPDIPERRVTERRWRQDEQALDAILADEEMIKRHDGNPLHVHRRDTFVQAIRAGREIPPLILLGDHLVDGYARYRALRLLEISRAQVLKQVLLPGLRR
jgi:hypothetical protein